MWLEKTAANTEWTARQLARHAGVSLRDVGYAGLKDRHAITRQWFSVRAREATDWAAFSAEGVQILDWQRHQRKLRRGAHRGNRFRIALRCETDRVPVDALTERLARIRRQGVPNFFGPQRFGRDGANLKLAAEWAAGRKLPAHKRSLAISTARSAIFNRILETRLADGSWNRILAGEMANLEGSGSVFAVDEPDEELHRRCAEFDIHPTGSLWGRGAPQGSADVAQLERTAAAAFPDYAAALESRDRVDAAQRALRMCVVDLQCEITDAAVWLEFELAKGAYATTLLSCIATIP